MSVGWPLIVPTTRGLTRSVGTGRRGGVPPGALGLLVGKNNGLALDFYSNTVAVKDVATPANNRSNVAVSSWLTTVRASTAWYFDSAGLLKSVGNNILRLTYDPITLAALGLLVEGARTNVVLHNRDLTQAAWVPTDVTPLKNQVGLDGLANSSSSITATAANGTILQAITLASSARFQTAYVKRLVGSGTLEMTMDNGSTWTAVTVTSGWTRVEIPTQTLANPTVGFRIATSGDSFAIDLVQNENGADKTSPIVTAGASVTRAAELHTALASAFPYDATKGTVYSEGISYGANNTQRTLWQIDDGTSNERLLGNLSTTGQGQFVITDGGAGVGNSLGGVAAVGVFHRHIATWNVATPRAIVALDGTLGNEDTAFTMPVVTTLRVGTGIVSTAPFNGPIGSLVYVPE